MLSLGDIEIVRASLGDNLVYQALDTGPGPKTLMAGGMTQGFFGETSTTELISGTALASMVGLSQGIAQFDSEPWLKFILDRKVLFVAKKPYRHSVSWDAINAANAVYGGKEVSIGANKYKVRLLKTSLTDPTYYQGAALHGGEWNRLMLPIYHAQSFDQYTGNVGPNDLPSSGWGIGYTDAQLHTHYNKGDGAYSWMQETRDTDAAYRLTRGHAGVAASTAMKSTSITAAYGWRPVLELVQ